MMSIEEGEDPVDADNVHGDLGLLRYRRFIKLLGH